MTPLPTSSASGPSQRLPDWLLPIAFFLLLSVLIVLPFFWLGTASGHDFEFHAASWLDVSYQWKEGTLYPRWTAWTNHGFGEPRYVFYPPFSWLLGAALTLLLPDSGVPIAFVILVQTFAGLSAYFLLRNLVPRRAALLASAFYTINPNALLITYIRSDFAEQLACAFFPLLLLAALRLSNLLDGSAGNRSSLPLFSLLFACVWLSNAPAAVIATYSVSLVFACAALFLRSWRPLARGATGLALGFGLTSFYLLPAAYEQRWVNIAQALASGLLPYQNFLFTRIDDPEHTWFNWIASICVLALILLLGLTALASRRFAQIASPPRDRKISLALLLLGASATLLTLRLTLPLWSCLPKMRFVQFPWRWMSIIALAATCFLAFAMERRSAWLWFISLFVLSIPLAHFQIVNTWWDEDEMPTLRDALVTGHGFDGTDEYDPVGDDHLDLPVEAPQVKILPADPDDSSAPQAHFHVRSWSTAHIQIHVDSLSEARVALRLLNYPAWRVIVNGKAISPARMDDVNQMVIPVSKGSSDIRVDLIRTPDRSLGEAISAASTLLAALLVWSSRKRAIKFN